MFDSLEFLNHNFFLKMIEFFTAQNEVQDYFDNVLLKQRIFKLKLIHHERYLKKCKLIGSINLLRYI